jgi:hypothetical protein
MTEVQITQKEYDKRIDNIKLCGINRGSHDYIPIEWKGGDDCEMVMQFMCRVCFHRVRMDTLYQHFTELKV